MKPSIYITRKVPEYLLEPYTKDFDIRMWSKEKVPVPRDVLLKEAETADGIVSLLTEKIDYDLLSQLSRVKIIANMAVGYDNIDVASAERLGITITNTPDVLTETTADLTFTLLMATARRLIEASNRIYEDRWGIWSPFEQTGTDIYHKRLGIVGMGRIGRAVARRARGFGMEIVYHNRKRNKEAEISLGASYLSFSELLQSSDFVVSLVPLTAETEKLFNEEAFEQMKKEAIFINVSRGGVVDERALFEALRHGKIRAAGLDVFGKEPIDSSHPLTSLPNVVLTPHIGSATLETREKMLTLCLDNIRAYFYEDGPLTPVRSKKA